MSVAHETQPAARGRAPGSSAPPPAAYATHTPPDIATVHRPAQAVSEFDGNIASIRRQHRTAGRVEGA